MAGRIIETVGSGDRSGGNVRGLAICLDCADHNEAETLALGFFPALDDGVPRGVPDIKDLGGGVFSVELEYSRDTATTADPGTGQTPSPIGSDPGGGNPPTGKDGTDPVSTDITFSLGGKGRKIFKSLDTGDTWAAGGGDAPDKQGVLGLTKDGIEGITAPAEGGGTFTVTLTLAQFQQGYFSRLAAWAGRVMNDAAFAGLEAGEVCFYQVDGHYSEDKNDTGWKLTFTFLYEPNGPFELDLFDGHNVATHITGTKKGHDFLDLLYQPVPDTVGGIKLTLLKPCAAYVERVLEEADFDVLGLGL